VRRLALLATLVATAGIGLALLGSGAQAGNTYRVDAIFDTAKGIIPGQLVKIAGARAGKVKDVVLTPDYKARIQMTVDERFRPFKTDASCAIQPEGLISENFVQCKPGTADADELQAEGGEAPTVPVTRTSVPVAITDLFNVWRTPIRQRFSVVVAALGLGTAGRGEDFNDVLRRANPTLALVRRAVGILNEQRAQVATIVTATDRIAAELAPRTRSVGDFIDNSSHVAAQTASHRTALAESIRRLPPLLDAAEPALRRLDSLATDGTPLLKDLRAAAPNLNKAITGLRPFAIAARPAIRRLGAAGVVGRRAARNAVPTFGTLRRLSETAQAPVPAVRSFLVSLRDTGAFEGLLNFLYRAAVTSSRYDGTAHILPARVITNSCSTYTQVPTPGCSSNYGPAPAARSAPRRQRKSSRAPELPEIPALPLGPAPTVPQAPSLKLPKPKLDLPGPRRKPVQKILDTVTGGGARGGDDGTDKPLGGLLDFLLK
jgi:ABC-type transporter Mla subunit MlaD